MICYSLLNSKVLGKRNLKFPFDIRELPPKYNYGSTQTYTKLKIYNHQTPKYSKGIWE